MVGLNMGSGASMPSSGGSVSGGTNIDPRYMVTLVVQGDGGDSFQIYTTMDETLAISMGAQWAAPFENVIQDASNAAASSGGTTGVIGRGASIGGQALQTVTGITLKNKSQSFQTWQTSDPMHFTIPFTLVAIKDPVEDIKNKVIKLLKLVAPSEYGVLLKAPGPTLKDAIPGGRKITLKIGNFITLEPCIVTDVQVQFDNVIGEAGIPLRAKVNVDIKSWYTCFTTQDIDKMFGGGGGGGSGFGGRFGGSGDGAKG